MKIPVWNITPPGCAGYIPPMCRYTHFVAKLDTFETVKKHLKNYNKYCKIG